MLRSDLDDEEYGAGPYTPTANICNYQHHLELNEVTETSNKIHFDVRVYVGFGELAQDSTEKDFAAMPQ